ncbi:MAG: hypothetical protein A2X49_04230 [Lentisphaerae bacterium GWF2_52_8]|nr:MAG: hypothetical protein A2X49_04230 [Lentisphaerae bacterium GWF2_52_8]
MSNFKFQSHVNIFHSEAAKGGPYAYALAELQRLLTRLGVEHKATPSLKKGKAYELAISCACGTHTEEISSEAKMLDDAYQLQVSEEMVDIISPTEKGILNGVYDMAERLGVFFMLPAESGEWLPDTKKCLSLPPGTWIMQPRFKHRGVFLQLLNNLDFSEEDWLRFYAKLRFNAVRTEMEYLPLCKELGLRIEVGGHGLPSFLPRELFDKEPELFRMFQPEDFNGKRMKDSNLCVSNLKTKKIVQENFAKHLETVRGAHAIHAWGDDLPAGGWCLCPSCRALAPTDQAMLAMRYLAEVTAKDKDNPRIPVIAYHDTIRPGREIDAPQEGFLLYAPRERCYGHALDDPSCERNRFYFNALKEWVAKFKGIDDSHTFEYYFDQILFRGIYPFLPGVILADMKTYKENGIECHMSLQVGGPAFAPEFNMLAFAKGLWEAELTEESLISELSKAILPEAPEAWNKYLSESSHIFTDAMRMCGHNIDIYLDYRWLPENVQEFGKEMALAYEKAAAALEAAANTLEKAVQSSWPERVRKLAEKEIGRARFEAAEFRVMAKQQSAMNEFGAFLNTRSQDTLQRGISDLEEACSLFEAAKAKAQQAGLPEGSWYYRNINGWQTKEFRKKIENYKFGLKSDTN